MSTWANAAVAFSGIFSWVSHFNSATVITSFYSHKCVCYYLYYVPVKVWQRCFVILLAQNWPSSVKIILQFGPHVPQFFLFERKKKKSCWNYLGVVFPFYLYIHFNLMFQPFGGFFELIPWVAGWLQNEHYHWNKNLSSHQTAIL